MEDRELDAMSNFLLEIKDVDVSTLEKRLTRVFKNRMLRTNENSSFLKNENSMDSILKVAKKGNPYNLRNKSVPNTRGGHSKMMAA